MAGFKAMLCALIVTVVVVGSDAADKKVTVDGITTHVKGQSGKIAVYKEETGESSGVTLTYDAIKEVDTENNEISSHSFENFAQLDFTFSDVTTEDYPGSEVNTSKFSFMASIVKNGLNASLTSEVFVFREDGNITIDGEDFMVSEGMMKFNIMVESWSFCDTCTSKGKEVTGAYLDVYIEVKSKNTPKEGSKNGSYELGDGAMMTNPKMMKLDNSDTATMMMDGYPALSTKGSKNTFTFRFPKFTDKVVYDPTISLGEEQPVDPNSATGNVVSVVALAFCAILKLIL